MTATREILIAVDETANRERLESLIIPMGYMAVHASDGAECLWKTEQRRPDLLLLGVTMPRMSGFDVVRRLRAREHTRMLPILMVASPYVKEVHIQALDVGADDLLTMPVDEIELAARVRSLIQKSDLYSQLGQQKAVVEERNRVMHRDLEMAQAVQRALVPPRDVEVRGIDLAFAYEPAKQVGGDLLDIIALRNGHALFLVADAMGHGVQASLVMAATKATLRSALRHAEDPARILSQMNLDVGTLFNDHFVTAACCVLKPETGVAEICLAGHSGPLLLRRGANVVMDREGANLPLGVAADAEFQGRRVRLEPDDILAFFTDGLAEAMDPQEGVYGVERIADAMLRNCHLGADDILKALLGNLKTHLCQREPTDDLTALVIKYLGTT